MSIFDHPDSVTPVATWRCPHCGTLQGEASRCWACGRSPVSCSSCRFFLRSVISQVGLCGLDRSRGPLSGDEIEPCWQAAADVALSGILAEARGWSAAHVLAVQATPVSAASPADATAPAGAGTAAPARTRTTSPADSIPAPGRLVEAPVVAPSRRLVSEALRRARQRRDGSASAEGGR